MAIFVDENTKVVYQGLTGSQGSFYGLRNRDYGTQVVACLLYTSPSPRDRTRSRMPSSA